MFYTTIIKYTYKFTYIYMRVYILELGAHTLFPSLLKGDPVMHLPQYDMLLNHSLLLPLGWRVGIILVGWLFDVCVCVYQA